MISQIFSLLRTFMLPTRVIYREIYIIFPFSVVKLGLFRVLQNWVHLYHRCQAIRPNAKECVCPVCEGEM